MTAMTQLIKMLVPVAATALLTGAAFAQSTVFDVQNARTIAFTVPANPN